MTEPPSASVRVAVDVGGTFTDVVTLDPADGSLHFDKVPTTPADASEGVIKSFAQSGVDIHRAAYFAHGTTLALNALLTRNGAKTAIVTTEGFRDVYLLGRTDRPVSYDFRYRKPSSLVDRDATFEVPERLNFQGRVLRAFDREAATEIALRLSELGYRSVAVCFLHAYANPAHELEMRDVIADVAPDIDVTLSHELTREYREYERTSTAVFDAYIKPVVRRYLDRLKAALADKDFGGQFFMIRSGGGAMTVDSAMDAPVNLILSGPAGGVIGATSFAKTTGEGNLITIDMGGTSLDASLIVDGESVLRHEASFEGLPLTIPSLYIHTIGAGGGSLVWIDAGGHLQVGPQSAGSSPGPAAYGWGGSQATFTDAALVVGYLGTESALAGTLELDRDLAVRALAPSAQALAMSIDTVALGVIRIAVTKIVGAVRSITVDMGYKPSDFALLTFGGGGGLVAVDVARELSIPRVIVPPGPGVFSALGMLMADVQHDYSRTHVMPLDSIDLSTLEDLFGDMEQQGEGELRAEGFPAERRKALRFIDMRYLGQEHSVSVAVSELATADDVALLRREFSEIHERHYGHSMPDAIEIVTLRSRAIGLVQRPKLPEIAQRSGAALAPIAQREVFQPDATRSPYAVYVRDHFRAGDQVDGPAIILEHTSTTIIHAGDSAIVGSLGELVVTIAPETNHG